jgi:hypothetical protein
MVLVVLGRGLMVLVVLGWGLEGTGGLRRRFDGTCGPR